MVTLATETFAWIAAMRKRFSCSCFTYLFPVAIDSNGLKLKAALTNPKRVTTDNGIKYDHLSFANGEMISFEPPNFKLHDEKRTV